MWEILDGGYYSIHLSRALVCIYDYGEIYYGTFDTRPELTKPIQLDEWTFNLGVF